MKKSILWFIVILISIAMIATFSITGCKEEVAPAEEVVEEVEEVAPAEEEVAPVEEEEEEIAEPVPLKIGYATTYGTHPSVMVILEGGKAECLSDKWADMFDVEVIMCDAGWTTPEVIVTCLEDLHASGIDGLLIFPAGCSGEASQPIVDLYNANNIPVVVTDCGIDYGEYVTFTVSDNYLGGKLAAEYAAQFMPEGSKVQAWNGTPGSPTAIARCDGYSETMEALGMNALPTSGTEVSLERGQADMEDLLVSDPDIKGIFATNMILTEGALVAIENAGLVGEIMLTPFDADYETYEAIKAGKVCAAVIQDLAGLGQQGAYNLMLYLSGREDEIEKDIYIPPKLLTIENWEDFVDDPQVQPPEE